MISAKLVYIVAIENLEHQLIKNTYISLNTDLQWVYWPKYGPISNNLKELVEFELSLQTNPF